MENVQFCAQAIFSAFPLFCLLFLTESKSVLHEKCWSSQMIKVCQKKFPLFKIKKGFLTIFVIFWAKNAKNISFLPTFLTKSKSVKHEKCWSSHMIKVCQKKFPLFKIKNVFLAIFVILAKTRKWPKIHFFFGKVEIFFGTP